MDAQVAKLIIDKIVGQVFGYKNPLSLEQFMAKFAFDLRLPQQVYDNIDNTPTWASSITPGKFIRFGHVFELPENYFQKEKRPINGVEDILKYWSETNIMAAERYNDSINVAESDDVTQSENVFRSQNILNSKNVVFTDGSFNSEYIAACQRSNTTTFSIRVEDSNNVSNSFSVNWSKNISNSIFIQDAANLQDCMFCSHITSKQYWIANMPFEKEEYLKIKDMVVRWILTG
jgi:hypothetical protein